MTAPDGHQDKQQLLLLGIKETVDRLRKDLQAKDTIHGQINSTLIKVQTCMNSIKIDLAEIRIEQRGFISARKDRALNCDKIHVDFEQRLRQHPAPVKCKNHETRLKVVEKKIEGYTPLIYKIVGGVIVISIIVPPMIAGIIGFLIKKVGG